MPLFRKSPDKEFAVIGLGRFGGSLARRLVALGHRVLGIDNDPQVAKVYSDEITETAVLDATDLDALRQVDITSFPTVVVAITRNFEANALITTSLKTLGIANVISISNTDRHRQILSRIGADLVILPDEESGYHLADELSIPGMLERMSLNQDYSLVEIKSPPGLVGKGLDFCESYEVIVLLILRGDELIINPEPDIRFEAEDTLILIGEKRRLAAFSNLE